MPRLVDGVEEFLSPVIGQGPARRLILAYCAKYNKQFQDINQSDLGKLGVFLSENLRIFVRAKRAEFISEKLKGQRPESSG